MDCAVGRMDVQRELISASVGRRGLSGMEMSLLESLFGVVLPVATGVLLGVRSPLVSNDPESTIPGMATGVLRDGCSEGGVGGAEVGFVTVQGKAETSATSP